MKRELLDQKHPEYDELIEQRRALYEGGAEWRELIETWLPKRTVEPAKQYEERKKLATYTNDVAPLIGLIPSLLFTEPLKVNGEQPAWFADWSKNVDRVGNGLSSFAAQVLRDVLIDGVGWTWVNLPKRDAPVANRAAEEAAGYLDAFCVHLPAEQVINWGVDDVGKVSWLVFKDEYYVNMFGEKLQERDRWTYLDAEKIEVYSAPSDTNITDATLDTTIMHGLKRLPVVRMGLSVELQAMEALRDPAVALIRARNALQWSIYRSAYAMLAIFADGELSNDLKTGEGYYIKLPYEAKAEYIEPGGESLAALDTEVSRCRDDLFRVMRALMLGTHSDALQTQSGESKNQDWKAFEAVLSEYARLLKEHIGDVLSLVSTARAELTTVWTLRGLDGWQALSGAELTELGAAAAELFKRSPSTHVDFLLELATRLFPDIDTAKIRKEIESYDPASDPAFSTMLGGTGVRTPRRALPAAG